MFSKILESLEILKNFIDISIIDIILEIATFANNNIIKYIVIASIVTIDIIIILLKTRLI